MNDDSADPVDLDLPADDDVSVDARVNDAADEAAIGEAAVGARFADATGGEAADHVAEPGGDLIENDENTDSSGRDDRPTISDDVISATEYRRRSRRAFMTFGGAGIGAYLGFRYIQNRPQSAGAPDIIRETLEVNERVWDVFQRDGAMSPTFSISDREDIRVNGRIGIRDELADDWSLRVIGVGGDDLGPLALADVQSLESRDMVWQHKCIEGWSNIVHWTGVRFSDFVQRFAAEQPHWGYASLRTPDDEYYVGIDRYTMMHNQTLLAWALNGEMLSEDHGAPLRLATPLKYGIKQLKRIASIEFTNDRPDDYWAERGYDYHSGF